MQTLSLVLPDQLAFASQSVAAEIGVSRTEFIRRAIKHELDRYEMEKEQVEIVESFNAMKKSKSYLAESEEMMAEMSSILPKDKKQWWKKKS